VVFVHTLIESLLSLYIALCTVAYLSTSYINLNFPSNILEIHSQQPHAILLARR